MNQALESTSFSIPLSFSAHSFAQKNYQDVTNSSQRKQIYLNSLAVYAVNRYLIYMGFTSNLENSDVANSVINKLVNTADLEVNNLGKIECLPVLPGVDVLTISETDFSDRIGYLAVQLNQELTEANILGFTTQIAATIPLHQIQSLEEFLQYLTNLEQNQTVKIGDWIAGKVVAGWQQLEQLLSPPQQELAFRFRRKTVSIRQARKLDLGMQVNQKSVALVMEITPRNNDNQEVSILLQVHPMGKKTLPPQIKLIVTDDTEKIVLEAISRENDNWIQLAFGAEAGESFSVTVASGDAQVKHNFIV